MLSEGQKNRLWSKIRKTDTCWIWTAYRDGHGFGKVNLPNRSTLAHRIVYEETIGPVEAGLILRHKCGNPACVNPAHLFLGKLQDLLAGVQRHRRPWPDRFWEKVKKTDGCWLWTASLFKTGYGKFTLEHGQTAYAHHLAWVLANGGIPSGSFVLHKCDNKLCVNPSHLFLGTQWDNIQDMIAKGRAGFQLNPNFGKESGQRLMAWRRRNGLA